MAADEQTETLRKIEAFSMLLDLRARWVSDEVNHLVNLPSWETKAEDELNKAVHQVRRTLQTVEQAQRLLSKLRPRAAAE